MPHRLLAAQAGGSGEAAAATMEEAQALLAEGKGLGLQLRGLPKLIAVLAQGRAWNVRAARALRPGAALSSLQFLPIPMPS